MKNEQSREFNQQMTTAPPMLSMPQIQQRPFQPPQMAATSNTVSQRFLDSNAIDITSIKGQFAWEKIPHSDICVPVIFRENHKYFCVRMLRKLLPDYADDVIHHAIQYQYRKQIPIYNLTKNEMELINRINSHHCRWSYARQPFTLNDELVRIADFLPFYEHLRHGGARTMPMHANATPVRPVMPQTHNIPTQRSNDYLNNMPTILRGQTTSVQRPSAPLNIFPLTTDISRDAILSTARPMMSTAVNLPRPQKTIPNPYVPPVRQRIVQPPPPLPLPPQLHRQIQSTPSLTNVVSHITSAVPSNPLLVSQSVFPNSSTTLSPNTPSLKTPSPSSSSSSSSPIVPPPPPPAPPSLPSTATIHRKPSISSSTTKQARPFCGWLQVNKLYTPYVTTSATNHHLYKLPVSLLSFYNLLKTSSNESNDCKEAIFPFEQTLATSEELELINQLCTQQNIQPFCPDTKLISLTTFYENSSANILFVKELSLSEPKLTISKDWASIIKINGGICRLRNTTTLNEQTVPFIGNNLVKNFILSSQTLSAAKLTKPTADEIEFLQMILFFSNLSMNLANVQLIDIESVQKEYSVDLILLYNDKFPLNVLNYQQQGNRTNPSQPPALLPSTTTAPTNTIAESTPPPSPPSPVPALASAPASTQLPLQPSTNRYNKVVDFHGHSLTAFVCSGLDTNTQRHCVAVKSLCEILFPNSPNIDKIEIKMLKLLRMKNINRFRPQTQTSLGYTRLIDIKDAEKYWQDIERGMRAMVNDNQQRETIRSSISSEDPKASSDVIESMETTEQVMETDKGEKRLMETEPLDDEDVPVMERLNKRMRTVEKENHDLTKTNDKVQKITIKLPTKKNEKKTRRMVPSNRTNKTIQADWVKKYDLVECVVQLNAYNPIYDDGLV